jgi:hypothetical protein
MTTQDAATTQPAELDTESWFESFVALPAWLCADLGPDLGPQLEAWIFSPPKDAAQAPSPGGESRTTALEGTGLPRDDAHTELGRADRELAETNQAETNEEGAQDGIQSEQHGTAARHTDAERAHLAERGVVPSPLSFWSEVVSVQRELEQRSQLDPKQALGAALVWVAVAQVQGAQRAHASAGPAGSARSEQRALDAKSFVERLHTDLEARATSALVAAWQLRASALSAAEGGRG